MRLARLSICGVTIFGLAVVCTPTPASAGSIKVNPGESIQAAVDSAAPGDTVVVYPGTYTETHGNSAAVHVTKSLKLIAKSKPDAKVIITPGPGNLDGVVVEPPNPGVDPNIDGFSIKGFTVQGFPNNGILLRYVNNFKIDKNESANNLENGIWPTLSANGLVKNNVAYGSEDSALWIESSENVRVLKNTLRNSPTGLEVTISKDIEMTKNDIYDNTVGVGLYHPSAAGLPLPVGMTLGNWKFSKNNVHNNNSPNTAPGGSMSGSLPPGGGLLVLGVDNVQILSNNIQDNNFYGISVIDYCVAVAGTAFDCELPGNTPDVDPFPDFNVFQGNTLTDNGLHPVPHPLAPYAADITYILLDSGHVNCFAKNTTATNTTPTLQVVGTTPIFAPNCL
jgi:parallel beta-helix repeat protein